MQQLVLWESPPIDPWIGKRVLYHEKRSATVAKALITTTEWGTLYELQVDEEPFPFLAYEDEWREMLPQENVSSPARTHPSIGPLFFHAEETRKE